MNLEYLVKSLTKNQSDETCKFIVKQIKTQAVKELDAVMLRCANVIKLCAKLGYPLTITEEDLDLDNDETRIMMFRHLDAIRLAGMRKNLVIKSRKKDRVTTRSVLKKYTGPHGEQWSGAGRPPLWVVGNLEQYLTIKPD